MEINEQQFCKGFNHGYILAQHEPNLLTSILSNISPINSYTSGLSSGQKEFEIEQSTNEISKLRNSRSLDKDSREI